QARGGGRFKDRRWDHLHEGGRGRAVRADRREQGPALGGRQRGPGAHGQDRQGGVRPLHTRREEVTCPAGSACFFAPKGRPRIARGASPWYPASHTPEPQRGDRIVARVALSGLRLFRGHVPGVVTPGYSRSPLRGGTTGALPWQRKSCASG